MPCSISQSWLRINFVCSLQFHAAFSHFQTALQLWIWSVIKRDSCEMSRPSLNAHIIQKDARARASISQREEEEKTPSPSPLLSLHFAIQIPIFANFRDWDHSFVPCNSWELLILTSITYDCVKRVGEGDKGWERQRGRSREREGEREAGRERSCGPPPFTRTYTHSIHSGLAGNNA